MGVRIIDHLRQNAPRVKELEVSLEMHPLGFTDMQAPPSRLGKATSSRQITSFASLEAIRLTKSLGLQSHVRQNDRHMH